MSEQNDRIVKNICSKTGNDSNFKSFDPLPNPISTSKTIYFKTHRNTQTNENFSNRKCVTYGCKVAQIAQKFNQLNQNNASLINEDTNRTEREKITKKNTFNNYNLPNEDFSDASDFQCPNRKTRRKKYSYVKRPSIKILVGKTSICGNVLSKRQIYETSILHSVEKPEVLRKNLKSAEKEETKEENLKTRTTLSPKASNNQHSAIEDNLRKRMSLPSHLYKKKLEEFKDILGESNESSVISTKNGNELNNNETVEICNGSITMCDENSGVVIDAKANESFLFRLQHSSIQLDDFTYKISTSEKNKYLHDIKNVHTTDTIECDNIDYENIYQSLCEIKSETGTIQSYETFENYDEIVQNILDNKISLSDLSMTDDTYILPEKAPEPPPPRKNNSPKVSCPVLTSTTSQLIKKIPETANLSLVQPKEQGNKKENGSDIKHIYHTIQSRFCHNDNNWREFDSQYEWKNTSLKESALSNGYESISLNNSSYSTINQILRRAISSQTLSSEQFRINSIYSHSLQRASEKSSSENSDDWVDLSDEDNCETDKSITVQVLFINQVCSLLTSFVFSESAKKT